MDISSYITSKREKGVYTEPAFDSLIQQQSEPTAQPDTQVSAQPVAQSTAQPVAQPVAQPTAQPTTKPVSNPAKPAKKISAIEKALLISKARASGLSEQEVGKVGDLSEKVEGFGSMAYNNMPVSNKPSTYAEQMPAADMLSASANGIANTFIGFLAGTQQISSTIFGGNTEKEMEAIRKWQSENEVQIASATKKMMSESLYENGNVNWTRFGYGLGNGASSVALSVVPALAIGLTGVGAPVVALAGAMGSFPLIFNSTMNSALDAGYKPEDAAKYAYSISSVLSLMEMIPIAKIGRAIAPKTVAELTQRAISNSLSANAKKIAAKIGTDGISSDVLLGAYKSVKNGITDRLIVNGGTVAAGFAAEAGTEFSQNYVERFGEMYYDDLYKEKSKGGKGFETNMEDITSRKQLMTALEDGFFGGIAGGGMSMPAILRPVYETGVYNTLAHYDKKGKLDKGIESVIASIDKSYQDGKISEGVYQEAVQSVQQVADTYKKIGPGIDNAQIKKAIYDGIKIKGQIQAEISSLEAKKQEVLSKIDSGEIDPDVASFQDKTIDELIQKKNKQFQFTSDWLKETSSQIFANRINSENSKKSSIDEFIDKTAQDAKDAVASQSYWKRAMGFSPKFAASRMADLNKGLKDIDGEFQKNQGIYSQEALKDRELESSFDVFDTATKIITDNGSSQKVSFVTDGEGSYAMEVEVDAEDGKKKMYRAIPSTSYYQERLSEIFNDNKRFDGISEKISVGQQLNEEESEFYNNYKEDIDEIVQKKNEEVFNIVSSSVLSNFTESAQDVDVSTPIGRKISDSIAEMKITFLSLKKNISDPAKIEKLKKKHPTLSKTIDYFAQNPDQVNSVVERIEAENKARKEQEKQEKKEKKEQEKKKKKEKTKKEKEEAQKVSQQASNYLNGTSQTQNDSVQGSTEEVSTDGESNGDIDERSVGDVIEKTDAAIQAVDAVAESAEPTEQQIETIVAAVGEVNSASDEIYAEQPSDQGSDASVPEENAGEQKVKLSKDPRLNRFILIMSKVFPNISIEVLSEEDWLDNPDLRSDANAAFISKDGRILLRESNKDMRGALIQELGHVAVAAIEQSSPVLYEKAINLMKGSEYEAFVRARYNLSTDEEVYREALGWAIQDKGQKILRDEERKSSLSEMVSKILRSLTRAIKSKFPSFNGEFDNMTLEDFSQEVAYKILKGEKFDKIFDTYINEYQPDPEGKIEYSLFGDHVKTSFQASQLAADANGEMTPSVVFSKFNDIENIIPLLPNRPLLMAAQFSELFTPLLTHPKASRWTKLTVADLNSQEALDMYNDLYSGAKLKGKSLDLYKKFRKAKKEYIKWVLKSHAKVTDKDGNESWSYIDHIQESELVNSNVSLVKSQNKGFWGKINQILLSDTFTNLFGFQATAELLGGKDGILSGIMGLMRKRNNDAATFAKYADKDINAFKDKLKNVFGLKIAEDYFKEKVTISAYNNMDGNPTLVTFDVPVGVAADIVLNYQTQYKNAPNGADRTYSSMYYDPSNSTRGATQVDNGVVKNRGISQFIEEEEVNLLFDDSQLNDLEALFATGTRYEFMVKDAFDFYSGNSGAVSRFDAINDVYINVKGESLEKVPSGQYSPTMAYSDGSSAAHRKLSAAYDDISFIKPRTDLPPRLQGRGDVLAGMESYNRRAQNFIRNAETAESLLAYSRRVKNKWNNKEMQSKLDWLARYRDDLNSYEQKRAIAAIEEKQLFGIGYRKMMSNFAKSVFAFNLANPFKQSVGYMSAYGLGIVENKYLNKYRGFVTLKTGASLEEYSGGRFNPFKSKSDIDSIVSEIESYDKLSDLWYRLEDRTSNTQGIPTAQLYSAYSSGQKGKAIKQFLAQNYDSVIEAGLAPMRLSDKVPIIAFYLAAKDQVSDMAASGGLPSGVPFEVNGRMTPEAEFEVSKLVTELLYKTTNMYMTNDKTQLQRSFGIFEETIGLFSSQPQKVFNLLLQNVFAAARGGFSDKASMSVLKASAGYSVILSAATTAAISISYQILRNGMYEDDDDMVKDFATEFGRNIVGLAPSIGTNVLISILSMFDSRNAVDSSAENPVLEQITRILVGFNSLLDSFSEESEKQRNKMENKAYSEMVTGLSAVSGVPSIFARIIKNQINEE